MNGRRIRKLSLIWRTGTGTYILRWHRFPPRTSYDRFIVCKSWEECHEDGGIEFEFPLIPTEEELRQMSKDVTREKLQIIDGGKNLIDDEEGAE
ncbi:hypothetical protein J2TS6_43890 [Paenibacillus albilobatus]|uniref:Uncharacterized protein n=1 Tax=Paenibacillus albilobatus TaxID=2716884 RepID=A0A919XKV0_9BACL|nr:hypothetical protein J2TS6_43890 [Paenibacillus albilobatus]